MLDEGGSTPELFADLADLLARQGHVQKALDVLEEARLLFPLTVYGRALLGGLLERVGRQQEAAEVFAGLVHESHLDSASARRVARHLEEHGQSEQAVALLRRLEGESPARCAELARSLQEAGQRDEALAELTRGVARWPEDELLFEQLAKARLEGEPPEVVVEELEVLVATRPHSQRLKADLALALRKAGQPEKARDLWLELLEHDPEQTFWLGHLAHCYRDLKEPERALEVLERILVRNPLDKVARVTYFAACREAGVKQRATAFVAQNAARDLRMRIWWGDLKKAFKDEPGA